MLPSTSPPPNRSSGRPTGRPTGRLSGRLSGRQRTRFFVGLIGLIALAHIAVGAYGLGQPLRWGHQGFHAGEHGIAAEYALEHHVIWPSRLAATDRPTDLEPNLHHPLGFHTLVVATTALAGVGPIPLRALGLLGSLLALLALTLLAWRLRGPPFAAATALFMAISPTLVAFAHLPDHQLWSLAAALFSMSGLVGLFRAKSKGPRRAALALWLVGAVFAGAFDWAWYAWAFFLWLGLIRWHLKNIPIAETLPRWALIAFPAAVLLPLIGHGLAVSAAGQWGELVGAMAARSVRHPLVTVFSGLRWRAVVLHGIAPLIALATFLAFRVRARKTPPSDATGLIVISGVAGLAIYGAVAVDEWVVHIYRTLWWTPVFALTSAELFFRLIAAVQTARVRKAPDIARDFIGPLIRFGAPLLALALIAEPLVRAQLSAVRSRKNAGSLLHHGAERQHGLHHLAGLIRARTPNSETIRVDTAIGWRPEHSLSLKRPVSFAIDPPEETDEIALPNRWTMVVVPNVDARDGDGDGDGERGAEPWAPILNGAEIWVFGPYMAIHEGAATPCLWVGNRIIGPPASAMAQYFTAMSGALISRPVPESSRAQWASDHGLKNVPAPCTESPQGS